MPSSKDPRSYVRPVPLPIQSAKGLKLQARDTIHFNPTEPKRDDVRKHNFMRRQQQMAEMGFSSANHRPYIGIGDPFYLDERKMILHALGQWDEDESDETSSSSDEENEAAPSKDAKEKPAFSAAKFVLRRSRKDLNTLNKAVVHGRKMIRNVRLGHGLFDLINKEKQWKKERSDAEERKLKELMRNEFQPPKKESDDDTDNELENDVDLTNFMVPLATPTFLTQQQELDEELGIQNDTGNESSDQSPDREAYPEITTFSGMARAESEEDWQRSKSAIVTSDITSAVSRPESRRKKKEKAPRPYTPQHTNISANVSTNLSLRECDEESELVDISRDALFRQLCVLHWVLEAMSTDPPSAMTPITSCWSLMDIGGSRAQPKKLQRDKTMETNWSIFLSSPAPGRPSFTSLLNKTRGPSLASAFMSITKRLSTSKAIKAGRRPFVGGRNSAMSQSSHQGSSGGLNAMTSQMSLLSARHDHGDHGLTSHREEDEDPAYNKSIFKFLDEYYESLKKEQESKPGDDASSQSPPLTPTPEKRKKDKRHYDKDDRSERKARRKKEKEERAKTPERLDHKVAVALGEEETMSSKYLRANAHLIRPKSSQALIDFQAMLPSSKKANLCANLHNQFAEAREEKALTLHDILEHKERQRMTVCRSKIEVLQTGKHGSSFHRAVGQMRQDSWHMLRKPQDHRKKSTARGNWYTDIMQTIPSDLKREWHYGKILEKLGKFGLVEGTGKHTIYKFLKVLQGLREWEICSPDVTAAIEFCRERIVDMTVEEYEWWFHQQFPKVVRPQTAPPASKTEKKPESAKSISNGSSARVVVPPRAVQSAFARRAQR